MERASKFALAGAIAVMASALVPTPVRADTVRHSFVRAEWRDLGTLGGSYSAAKDINERLEIVGWGRIPSGHKHAFKFSAGVMTDLDPTSFESVANAINDSSIVVGARRLAGEPLFQPATYAAGGMRLLRVPTPSGGCSWGGEATDINDTNRTVGIGRAFGTACDPSFATDGLWWKTSSSTSAPATVLGYPGSAELLRINNAGLAVGRFVVGGLYQPMSWRPGILRPLTLPTEPVAFDAGKPTAINDGGVIAGFSLLPTYRFGGRAATRWITDMSPGEVFAIPPADSREWAPFDINNSNFMVGDEEGTPWIYHQDFGLVFLPFPAGRECNVVGMTEVIAGRIYAVGDCGTTSVNTRATIWGIQIRTVSLA
ncbi:MAG TPA: hypothetical protein VIV63_16855, partial [Steroidobacteraceae bacterium]